MYQAGHSMRSSIHGLEGTRLLSAAPPELRMSARRAQNLPQGFGLERLGNEEVEPCVQALVARGRIAAFSKANIQRAWQPAFELGSGKDLAVVRIGHL